MRIGHRHKRKQIARDKDYHWSFNSRGPRKWSRCTHFIVQQLTSIPVASYRDCWGEPIWSWCLRLFVHLYFDRLTAFDTYHRAICILLDITREALSSSVRNLNLDSKPFVSAKQTNRCARAVRHTELSVHPGWVAGLRFPREGNYQCFPLLIWCLAWISAFDTVASKPRV